MPVVARGAFAEICMGVMSKQRQSLEDRVERAAASALEDKQFVTAIDVLGGLGWLPQARVDEWRQGRLEYLERGVQANLHKVSRAMHHFRGWAAAGGLTPSETAYIARTPDRRPLRFSASGDPGIELAYRTHWVSPSLSAARRERLAISQSRAPDLVVIWPLKEWSCAVCGKGDGFMIMHDDAPHCLRCAGLDRLVYLPAGDSVLTRRARKASNQCAVVVKFSRARKRYERQGILVDPEALESSIPAPDVR